MRKNEIIRELDNNIKFIEKQKFGTEAYKLGLIKGLQLAKESVKNFKRR